MARSGTGRKPRAVAATEPAIGPSAERPERRAAMASLKPVTLVDQIVDALIRAAAEGRFLPGDRVVEAEIARELSVSRVPVREALRLLESQGIVVNTPYRGMRLMAVDARHLAEIQAVRASLEKLAAREAAAVLRRDPAAAAPLEAALTGLGAAVERASAFDLAHADTGFHRALCRLAGNEVLLQVWETLARKLTIIVGLSTLQKDLAGIHQEHVALLAALKRGRPRALDEAVEEHIVRQNAQIDFARLIAARRAAQRG